MFFNQQFDEDCAWRQEIAGRLKLLAKWMEKQGLRNVSVEEQLRRLDIQTFSDKAMVAFVGESSRGKSELINAIFFAGYGRRIMPASAGPTTMCPTELGYDPDLAPCLRLLPIETRLEPRALVDWRLIPERWLQLDLDVNDAALLAESMQKVTEVQYVPAQLAHDLGFWNDGSSKDNPPVSPGGLVQIPKWRHALINIDHPLLAQGMVILDTPGLNAIGAESELTASLIPQAHAVVFILAAETGVTQSDLAIWDGHLGKGKSNRMAAYGGQTRLVVLNKIDTLWDVLSTAAQGRAQIDRQKAASASLLDLPGSEIIAVSAQKGLLAKITRNEALLQASQLPALEQLLGQIVLRQRQKILRAAVIACMGQLKSEAARILCTRRRELAEQTLELRALWEKKSGVVSLLRNRIAQEQAEFAASSARIRAVRSVHDDLLAQTVDFLAVSTLKADLAELLDMLKQPGIKLRLKKQYGQTFAQLRERLCSAQALVAQIHDRLDVAFRQINAEFGLSLQAAQAPDLTRHVQDLDLIEASHLQYFGVGSVIRFAQADFSDRLVRALSGRLRVLFESALSDVELWNKSASVQLDTQARERCQDLARRVEAAERIQLATSNLEERIVDLDDQESMQTVIEAKLADLIFRVLDFRPAQRAAGQTADDPVAFAGADEAA